MNKGKEKRKPLLTPEVSRITLAPQKEMYFSLNICHSMASVTLASSSPMYKP